MTTKTNLYLTFTVRAWARDVTVLVLFSSDPSPSAKSYFTAASETSLIYMRRCNIFWQDHQGKENTLPFPLQAKPHLQQRAALNWAHVFFLASVLQGFQTQA